MTAGRDPAAVPLVSWALRFREGGRGLDDSLDAFDRMEAGRWELLVVHSRVTTSRDSQQLDRLARRGARLVPTEGDSTADALGAALAAARGAILLLTEPGDCPEPSLEDPLAKALGGDATPAWALVGLRFLAAGQTSELRLPPVGIDAAGLLRRPWVADVVAIRVAAARAAGGFDGSLPELETVDLLARLPAGVAIARPLVVRPARAAAPADRARWLESRRRILEKYPDAFADPALLLGDAEEALREQQALLGPRLAARQERVEELEALADEIASLRAELARDGRDALDWGDLRSTAPVDRDWGYARGGPIDRVFIEQFLDRHRADVRGAVLEVQEPDYAHRFGGERVTAIDVVDIDPGNAKATVLADLRDATALPSAHYDAVLLTQTAHVIDDPGAVLREMRRILRPGGVLLATFPAASRTCLEYGPDGDLWRMTEAGVRALATAVFPAAGVEVEGFGNVLSTTAFLQGIGRTELSDGELAVVDPYFPTVVGLRAVRPVDDAPADRAPGRRKLRRVAEVRCALFAWHRVAPAPAIDVHGLVVVPEVFRDQLERIARRVRVAPLAEVVDGVAARRPPDGVVALTFDDGYRDALTDAAPALQALGMPATFFVSAGTLESPGPFWWDRLEAALLGEGGRPPMLDLALPDGRRLHLPTGSAKARRGVHDALHREIRPLGAEARDRIVGEVCRWASLDESTLPRPMDGREVAWLGRLPRFSIGAHGVEHLSFVAASDEQLDGELAGGRRLLGELLGAAPQAVAYPFGDVSQRAVGAARRAGYVAGVTCRPALVAADDDPLRLPRIEVPPVGGDDFERFLDRWLGEVPRRPGGAE